MNVEEVKHLIVFNRNLMCCNCIPDHGYGGSDVCSTCRDYIAYEEAVTMIDKNIAIKPELVGDFYSCPTCNGLYGTFDTSYMHIKFCPYCG